MGDDMWPWEVLRLYEVTIKPKNSTAHIVHPWATYLTFHWKPEGAIERAIQEVKKESWWDPDKFYAHALERKVLE